MPVGLHHLRYFVAVAEEGNVSRAADRLRIAQPSLSAQIKYLEDYLGTQLFQRHPRGVELTRAGALFLVEARRSLEAAEAAVAVARMASRGEVGQLRIGFIVGTQIAATSRILKAFRLRYPRVELEFSEYTFADPSAGLNTAAVDLAFVMPPFTHQGLRFEEIYRAPRVAVVNDEHPLARRATIAVRELFDDPWIVAETDDPVCRDFWLATDHRGGKPAKLGHSTTSIDKFIQLVIAGDVVGLAAAWVEQVFGRPGIRFIPVIDVQPAVTALAWRPGSPNPMIEAFVSTGHERPSPARGEPPQRERAGAIGDALMGGVDLAQRGLPPTRDAE
jgi:DNA-binding transcriptional LysR family regulator